VPTTAENAADPRRGSRGSVLSIELVEWGVKWADFGLILLTALASFALYFGLIATAPANGSPRYILTALLAATLFGIGFRRIGGYGFKRLSMLRWQATRVGMIWGMTMSVLLLVAFIGKESESYSRGWALGWMVATMALLIVERGILHLLIVWWARRGYLVRYVVIVGAGETGARLAAALRQAQDGNIEILGFFDDRGARVPQEIYGLQVLGSTDDLLLLARRQRIDEVIVALPLSAEQRLKLLFDKLRQLPVDLRLSAEAIAGALPIRGISYAGRIPMFEVADRPLKHWSALTKFVEDKVLGVLLLILFAPVIAIVALLIKLDSRGPMLFIQERFGFNNNVIRVLKFRTMHVDRGDVSGAQRTVRHDPRVTRVGRVLRALSLDELPQLINVVRGDMSLVGPRPHAITMRAGDSLYHDAIASYLNRHRVKPGITGWAQVHGLRGEVDTIEKAQARVEHDLYYIEHWSLWFDLRILIATVPQVLAQREVY